MNGADKARSQAISRLQERIGYAFSDSGLLEVALTHASVTGVTGNVQHNQRLEFLGDRVLGLLVAERLSELYPAEREGPLSQRLHALVNREACARVARQIDLAPAIRRSAVSLDRPGQSADTVLADACEALLGAVYLDGGLEKAREVFARLWEPEFATSHPVNQNPKAALQELMLKKGLGLPRYEIVDMSGPPHAPVITVSLSLDRGEPILATGRSRQAAEKAAAQRMLDERGDQ